MKPLSPVLSDSRTPAHMETGRKGEWVARRYLKALGYRIDGCNVRLGKDEIDILAFDPVDQVMVFAEVKTRSRAHEDYRPELNANWRKVRKLQRSARRWVANHDYDGGYRIDLLCVVGDAVVQHVKELGWD